MDAQAELRNLEPKKKFLVAIDSDGCAFDSMEIKHKECFIPNIIKHWDLQPVSKYARAAAEFVNLYSQWRGINRFPALTMTFDLLADWPDVQNRKVKIPEVNALRDWIKNESKLGNPALEKVVQETADPVMTRALDWSVAVNASITDMVYGVPPFPFVRESLEAVSEWADVIVCSATPLEALRREWEEHDIAKFTRVIAGQEMGSKKEHLALATDGKYDKDRVIMMGDAPGDMKAARANGVKFAPINPGHEEASWERFFKEGASLFRDGNYTAEYEAALIEDFQKLLPSTPPWKISK